ncbi:hypothetical protein GCM10023178_15610 [Actinomadura luteofluorescens]
MRDAAAGTTAAEVVAKATARTLTVFLKGRLLSPSGRDAGRWLSLPRSDYSEHRDKLMA